MLFLLVNFILFLLLFICPIKCLIFFTVCLITQLLFPALFGYSIKEIAKALKSQQEKLGFSEVDLPEVPSQSYLAFLAGFQYLRYNFKSRYRLNRLHFSKTTAFLIACFKMPWDITKSDRFEGFCYMMGIFLIILSASSIPIIMWMINSPFLSQLFINWIPFSLLSSITITYFLFIILSFKENKGSDFIGSLTSIFSCLVCGGTMALINIPPTLGIKILNHNLYHIFYNSTALTIIHAFVLIFYPIFPLLLLVFFTEKLKELESSLIESCSKKIYELNKKFFNSIKSLKGKFEFTTPKKKQKKLEMENAKKPLNEMLQILNVKKKFSITYKKEKMRENIFLAKALVMFSEEKLLIYVKIKNVLSNFPEEILYIILEHIPSSITVSLNNKKTHPIPIETLFHNETLSIDSISRISIISKENDEEPDALPASLPFK